MQGRYISPEKNAIARDWGKFVTKNLLPHDQVCERCNMIITADRASDLSPHTVRQALPIPSDPIKRAMYEQSLKAMMYYRTEFWTKVVDEYFVIRCPGCSNEMKFTGAEHLPAELQRFMFEKYEKVEPKEKSNTWPDVVLLSSMTVLSVIVLLTGIATGSVAAMTFILLTLPLVFLALFDFTMREHK